MTFHHIPYDPPYCSDEDGCGGGGGSGEGFTFNEDDNIWNFFQSENIEVRSEDAATFITGATGVVVNGVDGPALIQGAEVGLSSLGNIALEGTSITFNGSPLGGPPDSHLFISSGNIAASLDSGVPFFVPFANPNDMNAFEQRGTDITWSALNSTRLTINTDGVYDLSVGYAFFFVSASAPLTFGIEFYVNGATDVRNLVFSTQRSYPAATPVFIDSQATQGLAFSAGDYIEIVCTASDQPAGNDVGFLLFSTAAVTRRL